MQDGYSRAEVTFVPGDRVRHVPGGHQSRTVGLGLGEVKDAWGVFTACRLCFMESHVDKCPKCGGDTVQVSGAGIYDVKFQCDGKVRSIHWHWLRMADKRAAIIPLALRRVKDTVRERRLRRMAARRLKSLVKSEQDGELQNSMEKFDNYGS